jgi:hypothetical protein
VAPLEAQRQRCGVEKPDDLLCDGVERRVAEVDGLLHGDAGVSGCEDRSDAVDALDLQRGDARRADEGELADLAVVAHHQEIRLVRALGMRRVPARAAEGK